MIGSLRRKFVAIVMALVGAVLVIMLASSYWQSYTTQWDQVDRSLEMALGEDEGFVPIIGSAPRGQEDRGRSARLVAKVIIDADGSVIAASNDTALVDSHVLDSVIAAALASDGSTGRLPDTHVAWAAQTTSDGGFSIAIADTSDVENALRSQAVSSVATLLIALGALFAIAWFVSSWALRPVEAAWEQQRRFIADASHELKTPLAVIVANMGILQKDDALPQQDRRWVDSSIDAAGQMQGLVSDLLELARTDETRAGDAEAMHKSDVDFSDLVESAALEFDAVAFERGSAIVTDIDDGIHITGDRDWLDRLVKILIDNAVKYASAGSDITVALKRDGGRATLRVNNHGQVIPPQDLAHVFDRFYRSDTARSRSTGGFGLGLAIAKGIAEAHGGRIAAASNETDGTTFTVTLA